MTALTRGLTALASATAVVFALTGVAVATPTTASSTVTTVDSCNQKVSAGHFACYAMRRSDLGFTAKSHYRPNSTSAALTPSGYGPSGLQSAYKLPSSTGGTGQRVYIVDANDDPNAESDLAAYRTQYGLPACTTANGCFKKLNQNGAASPLPAGDKGWAGEISLDLDMVSAACPNCAITLVEANDAGNNLFVAVREAVTLGAKFVSMSWGGPELGGSTESTYDSTYFQASGVVYTASTGDGAYSAGVSYPATSPRVVAVGGTSLSTSTNSRGWTESVWKTNSTEGTGSGCSSDEAKPSWQSIVTVCSRRTDSDVSAVADPATGVAVYQTYGGSGWTVYGGTSASAPLVASVYALAGTPASTDQPGSFPYAHTANLFDVTSGNNGTCSPSLLCTAAAGWDGPTGLGTPNGTAAFTAGGGTTGNTVTVTNPGSKTGTVGTAASLQITATDSASGQTLTYSATGLPTGLSINATTGLISGTPSAAGTFTVTAKATDTTSASGTAVFTWSISATGVTCSGQKFVNPGFESGATGWTATAGVINTDGAHPHNGAGYAWLDGYGTTHTDTLAQSVTIPAGCHATLSYYLWITTAETTTTTAYDTLTVTAGTTTKQSFSNLNKSSGYLVRTVDVSAFAGQTVSIKWTGKEDSSLATSFFVDDTSLTLS